MDSCFLKLLENTKVALPVLVLVLKILMKLFVGRRTEHKHFFELLYELPTDIVFLALSFSLIYFFLDDINEKIIALIPLAIVIVGIIVVVIFRSCRFLNDEKITFWKGSLLVLLIVINYTISGWSLYFTSSNLLNDKMLQNTKHEIKINNPEECK